MADYIIIDHTADLGIKVYGADINALFIHAGMALSQLIGGEGGDRPAEECRVSARGMDWPDLMVAWMRELLYLWTGRGLLVRHIQIHGISPYTVSANVACSPVFPGREEICREIKAVTYHQIQVHQTEKGWEATIIFDV